MALTAVQFQRENSFFAARNVVTITKAITLAGRFFDASVCGDLHDALVSAKTVAILLADQAGSPTAKTMESGLYQDALRELTSLKRLVVGARGPVVTGAG